LNPGGANPDPRLRKLDELMWTYLRLLGIQESLARFWKLNDREDLPGLIKDAEQEVAALTAEVRWPQNPKASAPLSRQNSVISVHGSSVWKSCASASKRIDQAQENLASSSPNRTASTSRSNSSARCRRHQKCRRP